MSNLYKYSAVVCNNNEKKVIDNNEIISEKIVKIKEAFENKQTGDMSGDNFTLGIDAEHVEELLGDEYDNEDGVQAVSKDELQSIKEDADTILENARKLAEQMVTEAESRAKAIMNESMQKANEAANEAFEEGKKNGYDEGLKQGEETIKARIAELELYREELDKEYEQRVKKMEPELVDVLLKVFSEVTKVLSADKKDLIVTLVNSVMNGTEVSKNYIIKVSKDDAQFLRENKDRIQGLVDRDINLEIVDDPTLKRSQCLIDTDLGIFDCSLDIQLENLIDDIKILACSGVDYLN
ncbi:MAG: hypothetical protein K2M73_04200 [Lachnospiraceae bacterium]|nr:hypothetical protein [Lachnospiraceae bacterium]MDE6698261.1 hypothetical protein [Lachnospiraceae bacterium]